MVLVLFAFALAGQAFAEEKIFDTGFTWPSLEPDDCPFKRSKDIVGVGFTSRYSTYTGADTWYPSWDEDGNLYSPWTDGGMGANGEYPGGTSWSGYPKATTCHAKIVGDDPMNLQIYHLGNTRAIPLPYGGRYPCGTLCYNGIWYHGSYCLDGGKFAWWHQRPFVGFRWSDDKGKTWTETSCTPEDNLFGESPDPTIGQGESDITYRVWDKANPPGRKFVTEKIVSFEKIKMGAPHFVDFGKNMEHSPDGKAYIVGHGATKKEGAHAWNFGDQIYMARVKPSPETINDKSAWEFFAGHDSKGDAIWSKNWDDIKPLLDWYQNMGIVTITYNAPLKKYIMFVTSGRYTGEEEFDTMVLECDKVDGKYKLVTYMKDFGSQAYFVNMPTKFISEDGKTGWIVYSNNCFGWYHVNPPGGGYNHSIVEMKFYTPGDQRLPDYNAPTPFLAESNVATKANVVCSSVSAELKNYRMHPTNGQGAITGYIGHNSYENWYAEHAEGAWIQLVWDTPQTVDRVVLVDSPWGGLNVKEGELTFSDGSKELLNMPLPDDGSAGVEISFAAKTITWVKFEIKKFSGRAGLGEFAVFKAKNK
ncbi:MAG: hypothetical protein J7M40_17105 [Planctomycetes bacterium]|nr:hypothetical protein [Planctomycetota bacterium]